MRLTHAAGLTGSSAAAAAVEMDAEGGGDGGGDKIVSFVCKLPSKSFAPDVVVELRGRLRWRRR